jgi:hypothetical protein
VNLDLDSLLEQAARADPNHRIELRDAIARHGAEAVAAVSPWVADARLGGFAVRVIAAAYGFGATEPAIRALESFLSAAETPEIESDIVWYLDRLAPKPRRRPRFRNGGAASPIQKLLQNPSRPVRYMRAWTLWHRILDEIQLPDGRRKYLSPCHHWNNEKYVDSGSRRIQDTVPQGEYCFLCDQADGKGSSGHSSGRWHSVVAPWGGEESRLHLRRDRTWHLAADGDAVEAAELGSMYLTECGWWIERARVQAEGSGGERSPICEACVRFAHLHTPTQPAI